MEIYLRARSTGYGHPMGAMGTLWGYGHPMGGYGYPMGRQLYGGPWALYSGLWAPYGGLQALYSRLWASVIIEKWQNGPTSVKAGCIAKFQITYCPKVWVSGSLCVNGNENLDQPLWKSGKWLYLCKNWLDNFQLPISQSLGLQFSVWWWKWKIWIRHYENVENGSNSKKLVIKQNFQLPICQKSGSPVLCVMMETENLDSPLWKCGKWL